MTRRPTGEHRPSSYDVPDDGHHGPDGHDGHGPERRDGGHGRSGPAESTAPLPAPELTEAECRRCGTYIAGLDGRYACGVCGWVNDHSEGHRRLPRADEDPDRPVRGAGRRPKRPAQGP
ncbi:hypothetical protein ABZY44_33940 [Streptomyces sp. NPDC006544]|uniref:hypothetical protein n=1 Tax=Streptomyces sp. NPDC006544 TaxID=3154583 RepID=UPI0033B039F7